MRNASPEEIEAALVWDYLALSRGSESAKQFATAVPGEPERWWESPQPPADTLALAAHGVTLQRRGESSDARAAFTELAGDSDPWSALLGAMLLAWSSSDEGPAAVLAAREAISMVQVDPLLHARLLVKLATYAFDDEHQALGRELLTAAIRTAPPATQFAQALASEHWNFGLGLPDRPTADHDPLERDPLVSQEWVMADAQTAAQDTLADLLDARSRGIWTTTLHAGETPLSRLVGAEVQATWSGALWLRRPIRKQLGAQLLLGAATTPTQWAYGVLMWALGSGKNTQRAYLLAEPFLDTDAVDFLVRALGGADGSQGWFDRFVSVASEAWDSMSDDTLRWATSAVPVPIADEWSRVTCRRLWAGLAIRQEATWGEEFRRQSTEGQTDLAYGLGSTVAAGLSPSLRAAVSELVRAQVIKSQASDADALRLLDATTTEIHDDVRQIISDHADAGEIARMVGRGGVRWISPVALGRAHLELEDAVRGAREEARGGVVSFGRFDLRQTLAQLVAGSDVPPSRSVGLLIEIAGDPQAPLEHQLSARQGLVAIRRAGRLDNEDLAAVRTMSDAPGSSASHGEISLALLQIQRLHVTAPVLGEQDAASVVVACRDRDARVRQIAMATCVEALDGDVNASEPLIWGLLSGLFDPQDDVVALALRGIDSTMLKANAAARAVTLERLPTLIRDGSREVRSGVAHLAHRLRTESSAFAELPVLTAVSAVARTDRSWIVRTAADE